VPPSFTEKRVVIAPNMALREIEANRAGLAPVIFIPGWSAGADIWIDQMKRLMAGHRVISFDPRSQGESTKSVDGNTPEQRAIDLHQLIASERVTRPVLVGWSQAAQDVAAYVSRYGTRDLGGIVLVDAAIAQGAVAIASAPEQTSAQFGRFADYVSDQRAYLRGMFGYIISKPQAPGVVDGLIETAMKTPSSIGIAMLVADMFGRDRTGVLGRIDCPVLIIAAQKSGELERQKAEQKLIRDAKFIEIEDSAHAVFLDQPDRFAAALSAFLEGIEHRAASSR
jgi:non-heme chloroperoxidase